MYYSTQINRVQPQLKAAATDILGATKRLGGLFALLAITLLPQQALASNFGIDSCSVWVTAAFTNPQDTHCGGNGGNGVTSSSNSLTASGSFGSYATAKYRADLASVSLGVWAQASQLGQAQPSVNISDTLHFIFLPVSI